MPLSAAAAPSATTTASLTTIARKLRCMRASGVGAALVTSNSPASAADSRLIAQPASIAGTAPFPPRRCVGTIPIAHNTATTTKANARKRTYRLVSVGAALLRLALRVVLSGLVHGRQRLFDEVVQAADDPDEDADQNAP